MKTKIIYFLLLFLLINSPAFAFEVDGISYYVTSPNLLTVAVISGGSCAGDIVIPEKVEYDGNEYTVTSIGKSAFYGCSGMTSITIPNSVTSIGYMVFNGCSSLASIVVERGNAVYDSRDNCNAIIKTANNELIAGCKNTVIPNSVTSIGDEAFYGCSSLTSITIPKSVTYIGIYAFGDCSGLTSVTIPNSVTSIGSYAFSGCKGLTSVTIPNSVTSIGDYAFKGCKGLEKVIVNDIAAWCNITFGYSSNPLWYANHLYSDENTEITDLVIPNSVTSIGDDAFKGCRGLTSVSIPNSVTYIGRSVFSDCTGLTSVTIPNSVTSIGELVFNTCTALTSIDVESGNLNYDSRDNCNAIIETKTNTLIAGCQNTVIPNSVTIIGESAFSWCTNLTSVTIPNSVTIIGDEAFYGCYLSEVISLIEEPFDIEWLDEWYHIVQVFDDNTYTSSTLYVPKGTKEKYKATAGWNKFQNIIELAINPVEDNDDVDYGNGSEIDDNTNLSGNVVGNIYYNISDENGEYSSAEGCIVVRKPTSDDVVNGIGEDALFGEELKDSYTGIIFMVQAGSGTITVNAEATGGMTLKVKVGNNAPMEFKLTGKMEAKIPYTVTEPSYVYIYAGGGGSNAKGMKKASGNGELKIYGIEWSSNTDGIKEMKDERLKTNDSDVYNLNGQKVDGMPTKKGVYIKDGKKVLVK